MPASKASQEFIPIKEIRDNVVVLKDKSMRAVIMVSSINFALKSEDLQDSIIVQFQNFLNSLDFSVEISIQSRRLDIKPYLAQLEERHKAQVNDLLKTQIRGYINFIKDFTENSNIMTKHFFVIVPYASTILSGGAEGLKGKISGALPFGSKKTSGENEKKLNAFEEDRAQLEQRVAVASQGLESCGLRSARLGNEELLEFYYKLFNPGEQSRSVQEKSK